MAETCTVSGTWADLEDLPKRGLPRDIKRVISASFGTERPHFGYEHCQKIRARMGKKPCDGGPMGQGGIFHRGVSQTGFSVLQTHRVDRTYGVLDLFCSGQHIRRSSLHDCHFRICLGQGTLMTCDILPVLHQVTVTPYPPTPLYHPQRQCASARLLTSRTGDEIYILSYGAGSHQVST